MYGDASWLDTAGRLLMVFTVASTAIFHRCWMYPDPMKRKLSRIAVLANTGVLGGLFLLLLQNVR